MPSPDDIHELCPHCNQPQPRGQIDDHITTGHADIPPCKATLANEEPDGTLHCALRSGHRKGAGEYGGWHVSAHGPVGRTVWSDDARGATPHKGGA
jgi:hypothetical protein